MKSVMADLSDALAQNVKMAGSTVVRIEGRRRIPASGIVWSAEGVIVTANHVVRKDEDITIGLADGKTVKASVAGRDPSTDLAILKAEATGLVAAEGAGDDLAVGHLVLALGRPGRTVQATLGIVSALGEAWRTPMGGQVDRYLQTDVVMYPGFSGGPLVNANAQVVGLNTSALLRGVSLTLPAITLNRVVKTLVAHGHVRRGYLGVSTQSVRLPAAAAEELNQETGLLVVSVEADSPAEKGGLVLGDAIVGFGDAAIRHHDDLLAKLSGDVVGEKSPIKIVRGGDVRTVNVTVGERG